MSEKPVVLTESVARYLDQMNRYRLDEAKDDDAPVESEEKAPWLPQTLHDFLFHLSSPSDPTGSSKHLKEAVTFDIKRGDKPGSVSATPKPKAAVEPPAVHPGLPKTNHMIQVAHQEGLGHEENLHKKIGAGFKKTFEDMKTESPAEGKAKHREAKAAFKAFARSRGLKASTAPSMLRGNMKTEKSSGEGVLTTGLNLAPHHLSGLHKFDVCPKASSECRSNCLGTTAGGNRQYPDTALSSKVLRTHFLAAHPEHAARLIHHEIDAHTKKAEKKGFKAGVRLNVTSDIAWEHHAPELFKAHPKVQFYDYTKSPNRVMKHLDPKSDHPENYHLSLSHTGANHAESNDKDTAKVLHHGGVSAMVFQRGKDNKLPTHVVDRASGHEYPVVNGDDDDNTFDRHATAGLKEGKKGHGVVSGLMLKGVKNEEAGHFANKVHSDGKAYIN